MDERRVRALLVLLLAVAATAAAGGALDASQAGGGGSPGSGGGSGGVSTGAGDTGILPDGGLSEMVPAPWAGTLFSVVFTALALATVAYVVGVLYDDWRRVFDGLKAVLKVAAFIVVAFVVLQVLGELFAALSGGSGGSAATGIGGEGSGVGGESASGTVVDPPLSIVAILGGLFAAVFAVVVLGRGDESENVDEVTDVGASAAPTGSAPAARASQPGAAASRADVAADNEVYRAWLALVDEAGATSPRESPDTVARRAVAEGADEAAVREITSLFEAVRYGPAEATPERERRAAAARDSLGGDAE